MSESTQTVDVDAPAAPEAQKPEKQPKFRIVVDDAGNEVSRSPLGRGRPPAGSHRDDNDNLVVPQSALNKTVKDAVEYIVQDAQGNEISRTPKGRGRPKPGYEKQIEGPNEGHWVMVQPDPVLEATKVADEAPVVEVPAEAETADVS